MDWHNQIERKSVKRRHTRGIQLNESQCAVRFPELRLIFIKRGSMEDRGIIKCPGNVKRIHSDIHRFMGHDYHIDKKEKLHRYGSKTLILHHRPHRPKYNLNLSFISLNKEYVEFCMKNYETTTKDNPRAKPIRNLKLAIRVEERLRKSENEIKKILKQNSSNHFNSITPPPP
jgi:hypothetical protein